MTLKRAIVTSVGPLRIKIDGDTVPIPFTPKSGIDPATLAVGDVVHADQSGHRLVVLVRIGGHSHPAPSWSDITGGDIPDDRLPGRLKAVNNLGSGNDANTFTETGFYTGYNWVNVPSSSIAALEVIKYSDDWILQRMTKIDINVQMYKRVFHSGTTWSSWVEY